MTHSTQNDISVLLCSGIMEIKGLIWLHIMGRMVFYYSVYGILCFFIYGYDISQMTRYMQSFIPREYPIYTLLFIIFVSINKNHTGYLLALCSHFIIILFNNNNIIWWICGLRPPFDALFPKNTLILCVFRV
jgi:hypothetical protein